MVWLVCVLDEKRDETLDKLKKANVDVRPFFHCLSDMPIYKDYLFSNTNAKYLSLKGINLPTVDNIDFDRLEAIFKAS